MHIKLFEKGVQIPVTTTQQVPLSGVTKLIGVTDQGHFIIVEIPYILGSMQEMESIEDDDYF